MLELLNRLAGKPIAECTNAEIYAALQALVKEKAQNRPVCQGDRRLYYISAEFLLGKLMSNNLINLGLREEVAAALASAGKSLAEVEECECEPSLGNGGLGRLAACFLDSIATLGLPGDGVGLNYHFGLFRQHFEEEKQCEYPNPWMDGASWLEDTGVSFAVPFDGFTLTSRMYDIAIVGYGAGANRLHLFDLTTVDESIVQNGIDFDKRDIAHNLTLFLYPDDSDRAGQLLRIYQQYFMVSNAAQLILKETRERGFALKDLHKHVAIQINDTHPSLVIPELIRLLTAEGISVDEAIGIVSQTCAYTNHTILAEALETWPMDYLQEVVPHLVPILELLDARAKAAHPDPRVAIIDAENRVHMAHMDIHYGFSVNGVAALHTQILEKSELAPFYAIYPGKFNNKTNGITFRRWLMACNPALSEWITSLIGEGWKRDANDLEKLLAYKDDAAAREAMLSIKAANKRALAAALSLDAEAVFDIQIKRLHEYKRQQMNALYAIYKYLEIKAGKRPARPITLLFGAKAAPAYILAKDIIHLILCLAKLIREDKQVSPWLNITMVENYNVTWAERLIPACDISEQISLASKEASGTGNMKFMLNGAVTLGTMDGANVEISQLVGPENIYIFGKSSDEVIRRYAEHSYCSREIYEGDPLVETLVDFILSKPLLRIGDPICLARLYKDIVGKDWFMALLDLRAYIEKKERVLCDYEDRSAWAGKMLVNTANAGFFSSDRTIAQYNADIWHL